MKNTKSETTADTMNNDLHELFLEQLGDLYNAEKQLTKALPKVIASAQSDELKSAVQAHLEETRNHVTRLEQVAESLNEELEETTCPAMKGLIQETEDLIDENKDKSSIDAAIIAGAQKVEHYEIASYGTVRAWAEQMGHEDAVKLLQETLDEEAAADEKLTDIATSLANEQAENGGA